MKKLLICMLALALLAGCAPASVQEPEDGKLHIVATVFPAYDFARAAAGDLADVELLLPPGTESHSYEPTPADILKVQSCDLFLYLGGASDAWVDTILSAAEPTGRTLKLMDCVELLEEETVEGMEEEKHGHDHEEELGQVKEYDEHVWTSPVNAARIVSAICDRLSQIDPENESLYRANCAGYQEELQKLDAAFRETVENGHFHTLIFADRFPVRYFVEEYGLDYYAAFPGCADDTEPSAKTVAFLIDKVRDEDIPAVLYIEFSNEKMADVICEDTGCEKLLFHSCHNVSADQLRQVI